MTRVTLQEKGHSAYIRGGAIIVEWYDFGEHVPYESANMLVFEGDSRAALARSLGLAEDAADAAILERIRERFPSWFEAKRFAQQLGIAFRPEVDFMP